MPRLTVIMPAKNAEDTVRTAITSTLAAMPRDSELRVWNDCSTDETLAIATSINDPRVIITDSAISVGSGRARASLIEASDSLVVANMDADDFCFPWRFALQYRAIKTADFSFGTFVRFESGLRRFRPGRPVGYAPHDVAVALAFHNPLLHTSMLATRAGLERAGGYRDLRVAQDFDLWLRAASAGLRLRVHPVPMVGYRLSASQISQTADYAKRISSSTETEESFIALLDYLRPQAAAIIRASGSEQRTTLYRNVREDLLESFSSRRHRTYYKSLLRKGLVGPFGEIVR